MSNQTTYRPLTLAQVDANTEKGSLYIINATKPKRGELIFNCATGKSETLIKIRATWIPQDLTTQAKRDQIADSPDFRKLVISKHVHVLGQEVAINILQTEKGQAEQQRVMGSMTEESEEITLDTGNSTEIKIVDVTKQAVDPQVMGIVGRTNSGETPPGDGLTLLRGMETRKGDLEYIISQSTVDQIKAWGAQQLNA